MLRTLYARLSLALVLLLIAVGLLYTLLSLSSARHYLQQTEQQLNLDLARNLVADRQLVVDGHINHAALSATFMEYMNINPGIEIYLLDAAGNILSYSADPGKVKRRSVSLQPIHEFLKGRPLPLLGDDPRSHERRKIFSVTPVPDSNGAHGYLYVVLRGEEYDRAAHFIRDSLIWKQSGWALLVSLLFGLLAGLLLFRRLTLRLNRLSSAMNDFRHGDFSVPAVTAQRLRSNDEIDQLDDTFRRMARRINEQLQQLTQQDRLRRELVANVSHDLRTPMAILHGYLETLQLKDGTLPAHQRASYLRQALKSSERLNQLIAELFELACLEAQEGVPLKEPFNIAELAHDICQKFQCSAQGKRLALELEPGNEHLHACADIGLISRLFENLVGNAIKFTPAGGKIVIALGQDGGQICVDVSNDGPGIPGEELSRVFDRFYQGRGHGNRPRPGGLGLAIAKRIVELHGGQITAQSRRASGTTHFRFALPA